jgi:predicted GNAT family acetyltransferase
VITFKENELYQEIELFVDDEKIGEAEIEIKGKMLSRLSIFPPYQNKGYGSQIVSMLNEKYGCEVLWVNADNKTAIRTYEKNGYVVAEPTMFLMKRGGLE